MNIAIFRTFYESINFEQGMSNAEVCGPPGANNLTFCNRHSIFDNESFQLPWAPRILDPLNPQYYFRCNTLKIP